MSYPSASAILIAGLCVLSVPAVRAQEPETKYAVDYVETFKGPPKTGSDFSFTGVAAAKFVKFEPEGMRITPPVPKKGDGTSTGLFTRFGARGDFEITVSYEILKEPPPEDAGAGGTRISLGLFFHSADKSMANFSRKVDMKGGLRYAAWVHSAEAKGPPNVKAFPAQEKIGRLRLSRLGDVVSYLASEGADKEFKLLRQFPFGTDDVREIRLSATNGSEKAALDVRITELRVRAESLPRDFDAIAPPPLPPAPPTRDLPERVDIQFSDGIDKQPLLRLFGPDVKSMAIINPQGIRFTIPNGRNSNLPLGVESQLRLRGDFEITVAYELLAVPKPAPPLGAGVELWVKFDGANNPRALMGRNQKPEGAGVGANYVSVGPDNKDNYRGLNYRPAKEAKGQLRMVRTGKNVQYQIADGAGPFLVLASKDVGAEDVAAVRVQAITGWLAKVGVDVRFIKLELRAEKILESSSRNYAQRVEYQLRDGIDKHPQLNLIGDDADSLAKADGQGLRFKIPEDHLDHHDIGVESQARLRGDFEITVRYELLGLLEPPPGRAIGAVLQVHLDTPDLLRGRLGHTRQSEDYVYSSTCVTLGKDDKDVFKGINVIPANPEEKRGAMRFVRTGKSLAFQVAQGTGPFLTIATKDDFGTADVISSRALCHTAWRRDLGVDIRFLSLELRADQFVSPAAAPVAAPNSPVNADAPATTPAEAPSRFWLLMSTLVFGVILLLLIIAAVLWFLLRRRSLARPLAAGEPPATSTRRKRRG